MDANINHKDIMEFLKKIPPFQFLGESVINALSENITIAVYPANTPILTQGTKAGDFLNIIKDGKVKVSIKKDNEEFILNFRGSGETFGLWSLIGDGIQKTNITSVEETTCLQIQKELIINLLDSNASFTEYFLKSHLSHYETNIINELNKQNDVFGTDNFLFTTILGDIAVKDVVTVPGNTNIQETARLMVEKKVGSVVVLDSHGKPEGIITDNDLTTKVVAQGLNITEPAYKIMSSPIICVKEEGYFLDAVLIMMKNNIHHILVCNDNRLSGIITNHDLMLMQGNSPITLIKDLENQDTIDALIPISKKINDVVLQLVTRHGARASGIAKIMAELHDKLVQGVIRIAENKFGPSPVPYCWIVYGSEGRKEQTFKTDQDNAIIFADSLSEEECLDSQKYFNEFAAFVIDSLMKCGFPLCPSNYMASNPRWCQPLRVWKKYFTDWISTPTQDAKIKSLIFFDFRYLHGKFSLAEDLKKHAFSLLKGNKVFLGHIASMVIKNRPPVGLFGNIQTEKRQSSRNSLNLKINGIAPLVDFIRLFSLEKDVHETSTIERIHILKKKHTIIEDFGDDIEQAFEFILLLRMEHQASQIRKFEEPDNYIDYNSLSLLEKKTLKDVFDLITKIQNMIIELYKSLIW